MSKCLICKELEATKTNSHIIPSFLIAMIASYDQSYKRGKELMFRISPYCQKVHTGGLPDTKLEEIFDVDKLTDERIKNELSKSDVALDFIFCPPCEDKLSVYLETPYSSELLHDGKSNAITALFFWISVVWRMSIAGNNGFKLPQKQEEKLQQFLKCFFELKDKKEDVSHLLPLINFNYRILYCKDFCKNNSGLIFCNYDKHNNVLTIMIGDICICISFDKKELPDNYNFFSLESFFNVASINCGENIEERLAIESENYKEGIKALIKHCSHIKLNEQSKLFDMIWSQCVAPGSMPIPMKKLFIEMLCDENVKLGERYTNQRYVDIFNFLMKNQHLWHS